MAKFAWVENNVIRDLCDGDPVELFHPDVAVHYSTAVGDEVEKDFVLTDGVWAAPVPPEIGEAIETLVRTTQISPTDFKLRFTSQERVAIKTALATDPVIEDFYSILDDARFTVVNLEDQNVLSFVAHLQSINLLTSDRATEILATSFAPVDPNAIPVVVA